MYNNNSNDGRAGEPKITASKHHIMVQIERDFSDGTEVQFDLNFPKELEGKVDILDYEYTIHSINKLFMEAEKASCAVYSESILACMTAYWLYTCVTTHYEKCLQKVSKFVKEQNETVYNPKGLILIDPRLKGLRVLEFKTGPIIPYFGKLRQMSWGAKIWRAIRWRLGGARGIFPCQRAASLASALLDV
jgi:hypothetical protein